MVPRTFNWRLLVWLVIAILAITQSWLWFAPASPTTYTPLPEPVAQITQSHNTAITPPVDALWERYQQLNQLDAAPSLPQADASSAIASADTSSYSSAEAEKRQRRSERQEARTQRLQAIRAAQAQLTDTLSNVKPGDTATVITAMEQFDKSLSNAGVDNPIDMQALKRLLVTTDKLNQLNTALLSEAERGGKANTEKMRQLSLEIQQLLSQLQPVTIKPSPALREGTK